MRGKPIAVRFRSPEDGSVRLGALRDGTVHDAGPDDGPGFVGSREGWERVDAASGPELAVDDVQLLPPVRPSKVIAIGLNYRSHVEETNLAMPDAPVIFSKWPSCLIGHGAPIVLPEHETRPDYEGELAVVFQRRFSGVGEDDAVATIGGYCAFNDVSGRRAQLETPMRQFDLGKSFDTFGPMGPGLVRSDGVDLGNLGVRTVVSGETMQDASTRQLIFTIEQLVAYLAQSVTIEAGDVLVTGTPGGVGDERKPPRYLRPGDTVSVEIEGCPPLVNPVEAATGSAA